MLGKFKHLLINTFQPVKTFTLCQSCTYDGKKNHKTKLFMQRVVNRGLIMQFYGDI